ncbi:MAG: SUMF1/EgtB/PvdO family nonheme iron enzyme, partial [Chloroflexota bacterium]
MTDNDNQPIAGRYRILGPLGKGGMASVFRAHDDHLDVEVAVKFIRTEALPPSALDRALKRFDREAKSLAKIIQPNIVKVLDYGEYNGMPFLVMPLLTGGTLRDKLTGRPMPWKDATRLLLPVARALAYAHLHNLVHRDVKPSNILITASGDPMLADFGIAKILSEEAPQGLTGTNVAVGTPEYMAPEQVSSKNVDARADIYSLGVVFYEMVTGRRPFVADTPMAVLLKQASEPLPPPKRFVPSLPDEVETILAKALAKRPDERFQTMNEFASALEGLLTGRAASGVHVGPGRSETTIVEGIPAGPTREAGKLWYRSVWLWAGGMVAIFLCLAGAMFVARIASVALARATAETLPSSTPVRTEAPPLTEIVHAETPTLAPPAKPPSAVPSPTPAYILYKGWKMNLVPEGEFIMGLSASEAYNECQKYDSNCKYEWFSDQPPHPVYLSDFYIDIYEVTNGLYKACVDEDVCDPPIKTDSQTRSDYYGNPEYNEYPVINVNAEMAQTFCQWRGAQLPTEAQWEKAARGDDERIYPWGSGLDCDHANFGSDLGICSVGDTAKVGSYPLGVSPYGLFDMAGNVWEWVADWYDKDYYGASPFDNPLGPSSGNRRVARGGSFFHGPAGVQSSRRAYWEADAQLHRVGFR